MPQPQYDISAQVEAATETSIASLLGSTSAPSAAPTTSAPNGTAGGTSSYMSAMSDSSLASGFSGLAFSDDKGAHKPAETAPQQAQAAAAFNNSSSYGQQPP